MLPPLHMHPVRVCAACVASATTHPAEERATNLEAELKLYEAETRMLRSRVAKAEAAMAVAEERAQVAELRLAEHLALTHGTSGAARTSGSRASKGSPRSLFKAKEKRASGASFTSDAESRPSLDSLLGSSPVEDEMRRSSFSSSEHLPPVLAPRTSSTRNSLQDEFRRLDEIDAKQEAGGVGRYTR